MLSENSIMQFIPIFFMLFYGFYETTFISLFRSGLGRLFLIIVIVFYTAIDKKYGLIACIIAVVYYWLTNDQLELFTNLINNQEQPAKEPSAAKPSADEPSAKLTLTPSDKPDSALNSRELPPVLQEPFTDFVPNTNNTVFFK